MYPKSSTLNPKPLSTILSETDSPQTDQEKSAMANVPYRKAVGMLNWLAMMTRPDIAYATSVVSRFAANPGKAHWNAVKRIIRYLRGTDNLALRIQPNGLNLIGYSDSDYGRDSDTYRPQGGICFLMGGSLIVYKSARQQTVANSTMVAELMSLGDAVQESMWLSGLFEELGIGNPSPVLIHQDNQPTICFAKNKKNHSRARHVERKYAFVREAISNKDCSIEYCPTDSMIADIFTKPLSDKKIATFCKSLGLETAPIQGGC